MSKSPETLLTTVNFNCLQTQQTRETPDYYQMGDKESFVETPKKAKKDVKVLQEDRVLTRPTQHNRDEKNIS